MILDPNPTTAAVTPTNSLGSSDFLERDEDSSFFQVWHQEGEEEGKIVEDDDVIMQLDADEGLLNLNDFYDSISADTSPPEQLLADAVLQIDNDSDANSFFSCCGDDGQDDDHQQHHPRMSSREFQESMKNLTQSMQKSQATRQSLYAQTPKLKDYQRSGTVENVVRRIEYSSSQIDTYYSSVRTTF